MVSTQACPQLCISKPGPTLQTSHQHLLKIPTWHVPLLRLLMFLLLLMKILSMPFLILPLTTSDRSTFLSLSPFLPSPLLIANFLKS